MDTDLRQSVLIDDMVLLPLPPPLYKIYVTEPAGWRTALIESVWQAHQQWHHDRSPESKATLKRRTRQYLEYYTLLSNAIDAYDHQQRTDAEDFVDPQESAPNETEFQFVVRREPCTTDRQLERALNHKLPVYERWPLPRGYHPIITHRVDDFTNFFVALQRWAAAQKKSGTCLAFTDLAILNQFCEAANLMNKFFQSEVCVFSNDSVVCQPRVGTGLLDTPKRTPWSSLVVAFREFHNDHRQEPDATLYCEISTAIINAIGIFCDGHPNPGWSLSMFIDNVGNTPEKDAAINFDYLNNKKTPKTTRRWWWSRANWW